VRPPAAVAIHDVAPIRSIGPITQTDIVRFAGAGGDFNPLHHDPAFASRAGFRSVIAMGQMQAGMLAAYLTDWLGVENLQQLEVRFVAPVHLGDVLEFAAQVVDVTDSTASIEAWVSVDGNAVITGSAQIAVVPIA
jgi:acyl dehydratase